MSRYRALQHKWRAFSLKASLAIKHALAKAEVKIAIKAGVAASLSLFFGLGFSKLMGRPSYLISGTWCVLSTFIVLQGNLGGTYRAASTRGGGVLIGSLMGGLFTSLFGSDIVSLGFSVTLTVMICSILNLKESIRIACLSLSVVMILWGLHPEISPWVFGLFRFLDSCLGILIAVSVAHTLWPAQATLKIRFHIAKTLNSLSRLYRIVTTLEPLEENQRISYRKLSRQIRKMQKNNRAFLEESRLELLTRTSSIEDWSLLIDYLDNIYESITVIRGFHKYNIKKILDEPLLKELENMIEATILAFQEISCSLETRESVESYGELSRSVDNLTEELLRFRKTRTTRQFEFRDVENYFVLFYNLRAIVEVFLKMEEKVKAQNAKF